MDFSIVIPTWNRSHLVDALLKSLFEERNRYEDGRTEVIVVDSSTGEEKESIVSSCKQYDARYIDGDDSVRKKRNKGIRESQYDYILFIDSDVVVEKGLLNEYVDAYKKNNFVRLGGVLGYTEFVGKKTFWWKILELTSLVNSFSFARDYPFHSWTIGNNVSFKKSVLEEIGMFVLLADYCGDIRPNPEEIEELRWVDFGELKEELTKNPEHFTAWFIIAAPKVLKRLSEEIKK